LAAATGKSAVSGATDIGNTSACAGNDSPWTTVTAAVIGYAAYATLTDFIALNRLGGLLRRYVLAWTSTITLLFHCTAARVDTFDATGRPVLYWR
ncbi:MAG: hypothetical protein JZU63_10755, partial [Rhodoferax sp.]|nr:hypothetical protein [Rhodoferax sp.]